MSIHDNLSEMLKKPESFEILDHLNVDEIDELVRRNLIVILVKKDCSNNILRDLLAEHLANAQLEVMIIHEVNELFTVLRKNISRVSFVYCFYPVINELWKLKGNPLDFYSIFKSLHDFGIGIFPNNKSSYFINSLVYHKMMQDHYPEMAYPMSSTVFFPKWNSAFNTEFEDKVLMELDKLRKGDCKVAVIKKSFSNGKYGKRYVKLDESEDQKRKIVKSLDYTDEGKDGKMVNKGEFDKCGFKTALIHPYCKEKPGSIHSLWFLSGKFTDVFYCNNDKIVEHYDNPFLNKLKEFGMRVMDRFVKDMCGEIPNVVRIDVGAILSKNLLDEYADTIKDKKVRFYVDKIDINASMLFACSKDGLDNFVNESQNKILKSLLMDLYMHNKYSKVIEIAKKL